MKRISLYLMVGTTILAFQLSACASPSPASPSPKPTLEPAQGLVEDLSAFIPAQMQAANVPGLSIALIQEGAIVWAEGFGKANSLTGKPDQY